MKNSVSKTDDEDFLLPSIPIQSAKKQNPFEGSHQTRWIHQTLAPVISVPKTIKLSGKVNEASTAESTPNKRLVIHVRECSSSQCPIQPLLS
ncbi:hypothetical protein Ciccas_003064, partial [Cichlidogyrus casuarinus]